ncbi:hemerythrin domain-containing protein [Plantactinospora sp. CA-290183]|uniref:hemerythrin domain-containing protein n=1 Tax=Plantactinospora sp. CA-290183 TaxID=3240006 RepID=UPI003D931A01
MRQDMTGEEHWLTRRTGIVPSAVPTERLSPKSVLDETTRPTAAEPPPEVAFTPRGRYAGRHLVDVHDHYRAELSQVRDLLRQVKEGTAELGDARGQLNMMTIRANDWTLGGVCQAQCRSLTNHHTMESEGIFPHLRHRQGDLAAVLDRLHEEHLAIHRVLEEIDAALVHLAANPTDYGPITEAIDLLTDTLLSHFAYEEQQLIAPLSRHGFFPGQL